MNYPEHKKLQLIYPQSRAAGDFLTWLTDTKEFALCEVDPGPEKGEGFDRQWMPTTQRVEALLAEYFDIDTAALETEKQAMLKRAQQVSP